MKDSSKAAHAASRAGTPDERVNGPVWNWFGLTYANFLVVHRAQLQSMPVEWQQRLVELLEELQAAYAHLHVPEFEVATVRHAYVGELASHELAALRITASDSPDGATAYTSPEGRELNPGEHVGVPVKDPLPHYRHAYLEPDEASVAALRAARHAAAAVPAPETPAAGGPK